MKNVPTPIKAKPTGAPTPVNIAILPASNNNPPPIPAQNLGSATYLSTYSFKLVLKKSPTAYISISFIVFKGLIMPILIILLYTESKSSPIIRSPI